MRWEILVAALRAWARVRPQVSMRYSSTVKLGLEERVGAAAVAERRQWRGKSGELRNLDRMQLRRRGMAPQAIGRRRGNAGTSAARLVCAPVFEADSAGSPRTEFHEPNFALVLVLPHTLSMD